MVSKSISWQKGASALLACTVLSRAHGQRLPIVTGTLCMRTCEAHELGLLSPLL